MTIRTIAIIAAFLSTAVSAEEDKQLLWGDTHLHTSYSFDAFLNGNHTADPEVAYRFAKGLPVIHPYNRTRVQINTPLDFLVVSDHAEFYGGIRDIYNDGIQVEDPGFIERIAFWWAEREIRQAIDNETGPQYFAGILPESGDPIALAKNWTEDTGASAPPGAKTSATNAWQRMRDMAEAHNEPGTFSTILGWEWSSIPGGANLHRIVVTDADGATAGQFMPLSSTDSPYPQDLWTWLDKTSAETGVNFVAIPHNSNISKGLMFGEQTLKGEPLTAEYATQRMRWETISEITQIKGDSETHPTISPEDTFADFENYPWYIQPDRSDEYKPTKGDFIRSGLMIGLELGEQLSINPYQFGVIGSTDSHTGLASAEEPNFWGKMAYDSVPERKQGNALAIGPTGWSMQAGGLAAVWARENTREAIVDAFRRKEVYATTGPRIRLQFNATLGEESLPMGSSLNTDQAPTFVVTAQMDPASAHLDRIQIIKGWLNESGEAQEKVFDVAWSQRALDAQGNPTAVGTTVDLKTGTWTNSIGAPELSATWQDPEHQPGEIAFYYARVLEIPTPRHALLDALALGLEAPTEGPSTIQERAYSSAIWINPPANN